jgi:hypothetical protein
VHIAVGRTVPFNRDGGLAAIVKTYYILIFSKAIWLFLPQITNNRND